MVLSINFNADDAEKMYVGETATVSLSNSFSKISGTVSYITSGTTYTEY